MNCFMTIDLQHKWKGVSVTATDAQPANNSTSINVVCTVVTATGWWRWSAKTLIWFKWKIRQGTASRRYLIITVNWKRGSAKDERGERECGAQCGLIPECQHTHTCYSLHNKTTQQYPISIIIKFNKYVHLARQAVWLYESWCLFICWLIFGEAWNSALTFCTDIVGPQRVKHSWLLPSVIPYWLF